MSLSSMAVMRWIVCGVMCTLSPGQHLALLERFPFLNLEEQFAGPQKDRLVLHVVILQAQRVAGIHVQHFPTYRSVFAQCSS